MKKTALELTPQEWRAYQPARALEGRRQNTEERLGQRKQRAWRVAHQAAHIVRNECQAEKVVVFGSFAHKAWFPPHQIMDALEELDWCSGSQFDPMIANIMIRLIQEKQIEQDINSPI